MNTAIFKDWTLDKVEELVGFGVQRKDAEDLMRYVRNGGIASEAEARNDAQFLLDFKRHGSTELGRRHGKSGAAMRKKHAKLINRNHELRAELHG
jgi:hypothetical protein